MLLHPGRWSLASVIDDVLEAWPRETCDRVSSETHASAIELRTGVHGSVSDAIADLARLRSKLAAVLEGLGLTAAVSGRTRRRSGTTWRSPRGGATRSSTAPCRACLGADAALPGLSARRDPARVRLLRGTCARSTCCSTAARSPTRRTCGGTCAAAEARHDRGADHGCAVDARRDPRHSSPSSSRSCASRSSRAMPTACSCTPRDPRREPLSRRPRRNPRGARRPRARARRPGGDDRGGPRRRLRAARARARLYVAARAGRGPARGVRRRAPAPARCAGRLDSLVGSLALDIARELTYGEAESHHGRDAA